MAHASVPAPWGWVRVPWKLLLGVEPVLGQLLGVNVDSDAGYLACRKPAVHDFQGVGQEVIAHVQKIGELPRPPGGGLEGRTERDGAQGSELAIDLVAHYHLGT